jgi:hypothetical protein
MSAFLGLKVVDCSQGLVGPMAAMHLADFGAEVLKLEPPGGDRAAAKPGYQMWNRNKRRLTLDLDGAAGRQRLEQLLAAADVAIFDFTPKRMAALGLMDAAQRHPRLIRLWTALRTTGEWWHGGAPRGADGADRRGVPAVELRGAAGYLIAPVLHYAQAAWRPPGRRGAAERRIAGFGQAVTVEGLNAVALVEARVGHLFCRPAASAGRPPSYRLNAAMASSSSWPRCSATSSSAR